MSIVALPGTFSTFCAEVPKAFSIAAIEDLGSVLPVLRVMINVTTDSGVALQL